MRMCIFPTIPCRSPFLPSLAHGALPPEYQVCMRMCIFPTIPCRSPFLPSLAHGALPPAYHQYFTDASKGGSLENADYCPYYTAYSNTHCDDASNNPSGEWPSLNFHGQPQPEP